MKHFLLSLTLVFFVGAFAMPQVAEAKRFGGGKSFGMQKNKTFQQRKATQQQRQAQRQQAQQQRQKTVANSGTNKWLGPLAGLAAGGLLAWMFFGDGFEGFQIMDFLLIGLLIFGAFMLFKMLSRRGQEQAQPAYQTANSAPVQTPHQPVQDNNARFEAPVIGSGLSASATPAEVAPSWFNAERFVEDAKGHFMSVQEAWNKADASLIEKYVSQDLFAELKGLIEEQEHATSVEDLSAELVDESYDGEYFVASILFKGFIQEGGEAAHAFTEVWHIRRLHNDSGNWEIAGIQQIN